MSGLCRPIRGSYWEWDWLLVLEQCMERLLRVRTSEYSVPGTVRGGMLTKIQLRAEICTMDWLQRRPSCDPFPALISSASSPRPRWPLYSRHDGKHSLCWCDSEAGKIPLPRWPAARRRGNRRSFRICTTNTTCYCGKNSHVDRKDLAIWWLSCLWRLHTLRHAKDPAPCETGATWPNEEGCGQ